jgi:hypothetical protein
VLIQHPFTPEIFLELLIDMKTFEMRNINICGQALLVDLMGLMLKNNNCHVSNIIWPIPVYCCHEELFLNDKK